MLKRLAIFICLTALSFAAPVRADLTLYQTRYYDIYTDIDPAEEKEAAIRMTRMAEEYHNRTRDFSGQIRERLPFYLYRSSADYYAAGGMKGSAGVFISNGSGGKLMAIAGQKSSLQTWHVVQHEGFHQFVHMAIGGSMPTWLNEGLAEFFGESIFTGDGFVTGVVPPWRLKRFKEELASGELKTFDKIATTSGEAWANQMNIQNYDQAWSMVHFLVNADDQKYQPGLFACLREISHGRSGEQAMRDTLAKNMGIEERWKTWWTEQPQSPTSTLYGRAAVATMTSFIGRCYAQKQTFVDFEAFRAAAESKALKISADDWLPDSLIESAFRLYAGEPNFELRVGSDKQPQLGLVMPDGTRMVGSFVLRNSKVEQVNVSVDDMAAVLKDAQLLLNQKKKEQARLKVLSAIKAIPDSALMSEAKKFLQSCR